MRLFYSSSSFSRTYTSFPITGRHVFKPLFCCADLYPGPNKWETFIQPTLITGLAPKSSNWETCIQTAHFSADLCLGPNNWEVLFKLLPLRPITRLHPSTMHIILCPHNGFYDDIAVLINVKQYISLKKNNLDGKGKVDWGWGEAVALKL